MEVAKIKNEGSVVLRVAGRLDTSTSADFSAEVERLLADCRETDSVTVDAADMEYISSSGLRVFLALAKKYGHFRVAEANDAVYQVFDMTGFTKIMTVEKALRQMSVDGCEIVGRGGVGVVYRIDDDTIIKVFREGTSIDEVRTEITMAKEAFVLGMPTAISFDIVRVGSQYGLVYELLQAETLSACIARDPGNIDMYARRYAELFRHLHTIEVPAGGIIPDALACEEEAVRHISRYFDTASIDILLNIVHSIPCGNRLMHCDLQTKNLMKQGDEFMLIDMGEVCYGHPMIDLAHSYSAMMKLNGSYEQIIGLPGEVSNRVWTKMADFYFEGLDAADKAHRLEQIDVVSCVRGYSWLALSDSFPDDVIMMCQQNFEERVLKNKDRIMDVCHTLDDWKL